MPAHSNSLGQQFYDPLFFSDAAVFYQADEFRVPMALWSPGVSIATSVGTTPSGGAFTVTPASLMNVTVSPGVAVVMGGDPSTANPNSKVTTQGNYLVQLGSSTTVSTTAAAGSTRYDSVLLTVLDKAISGTLNEAQLYVLQGTPGAGVPPATPNSSLLLATIRVDPSTTTIASGNITEQRVVSLPLGLVGSTSGFAAADALLKADLLNNFITPLQTESDTTKANLTAWLLGAGGEAAANASVGGGAAADSILGVLQSVSGTQGTGGTHWGVAGAVQLANIPGTCGAAGATSVQAPWSITVATGVVGPFLAFYSHNGPTSIAQRGGLVQSGQTISGVVQFWWAGTSPYGGGSNGPVSIVLIGQVPNGGKS